MKKPKYKVGDKVFYFDRADNETFSIYKGVITKVITRFFICGEEQMYGDDMIEYSVDTFDEDLHEDYISGREKEANELFQKWLKE